MARLLDTIASPDCAWRTGRKIQLTIEHFPRAKAQPHRQQTERDGEQNISSGVKPLAFAEQVQGLQTEGGKRGVAAADADHQEVQEEILRRGRKTVLRQRQRREHADEQRTGNIHGERAPRKMFSESRGEQEGNPKTRRAAEAAAQRDPKEIFQRRSHLVIPTD